MSALHQIALTFVRSVGAITAKNLIAYCGDSEQIFKTKKSQLLKIPGIGEKTVEALLGTSALTRAEQELDFVLKHNIKLLFFTDEAYPRRLKNCIDSPVLLYFKGEADFNQQKIISVVGTRNATGYGKMLCKQLIDYIAAKNVMVISGLAYGIDAAAHKYCIAQKVPTIGVLGHGLDRLYPQAHKSLAKEMVTHGGLLTEFPIHTLPDRQNFPQRNRIIAGISDATIVVEASRKGGALITAEIANSYNRDVYAFPGRSNDLYSEGCNFLIKTNRAGLINQPEDLMHHLGWKEEESAKKHFQTTLTLDLTPNEKKVLELLQFRNCAIDELAIQLNIPQSQLSMVLLTLEMQGIIVSLPGKIYKHN